jgi:hypothetical protein
MTRRFGFAAAVLFAAVPCTLAVAQPTSTKQTYFAPEMSAPGDVNGYLTAHAGHAMEVIAFMENGKDTVRIYYDFGPITRSGRGVCQFTAVQVFPHRADDGTVTWDSTPPNPRDRFEPPFTMAMIAPNPCPRQNEDLYVTLDKDISDADFLAISNFWKEISQSQAKFDDVSDLLPLIISSRQAERFAAFRSAVFSPAGAGPMSLRAVFRQAPDNYDLAFSQSADSPNYFLSVSKSATGFQVLNFQSQF